MSRVPLEFIPPEFIHEPPDRENHYRGPPKSAARARSQRATEPAPQPPAVAGSNSPAVVTRDGGPHE
jgi:hypothetical protein